MSTVSSKPVYHVRHDLQPKLTEELLLLLWDKEPCRIDKLQSAAKERGYRLANRTPEQLIASLGSLNCLERNDRGELQLTTLGKLIASTAKYQPNLFPELINFTYYTLYDETTQLNRFSWAYRIVCDHLWAMESYEIESHRLITLVEELAQKTFNDYEEFGVSFSSNSVTGIVNWLEALDPPCVTRTASGNRFFARRPCCPVELVLLALEYVHRRVGANLSTQLQLTPEARKLVTQICLIEEEALTDLLELTAEAFGLNFRQTERGEWISLLRDKSSLPLSAWYSLP